MSETSESPAVVFEPLHPGVEPPRRQTEGSAGYDLKAWLRDRCVRVVRSGGEGGSGEGTRAEEVWPEPDPGASGEEIRLRLGPGDRALVPTGFRARLPPGVEAQIRIRSSLALRKGLIVPNAPGTIDSDYPDEWLVLLQNADGVDRFVRHGERFAQAVLARHLALPWREGKVGISTDRTGGLGSTDV